MPWWLYLIITFIATATGTLFAMSRKRRPRIIDSGIIYSGTFGIREVNITVVTESPCAITAKPSIYRKKGIYWRKIKRDYDLLHPRQFWEGAKMHVIDKQDFQIPFSDVHKPGLYKIKLKTDRGRISRSFRIE